MTDEEVKSSHPQLVRALYSTPELGDTTLTLYVRLWQLETWLRRMVYVELRAKYGNAWNTKIVFHEWSRTNDKELTHMVTPDVMDISYATFGSLCKVILSEWDIFHFYLPPKAIWEAKIAEVNQIRNRIAHFRTSHGDDLSRVLQLLRDIDKGAWHFYAALNSTYSLDVSTDNTNDPVTLAFASNNEKARPLLSQNVLRELDRYNYALAWEVDISRRPWQSSHKQNPIAGVEGYFYDVTVIAKDTRRIDYDRFLRETQSIHSEAVYIWLDEMEHIIRVILPAVLGESTLKQAINTILGGAFSSIRAARNLNLGDDPEHAFELLREKVQQTADKWPEYVIGPIDPIGFFDPTEECKIFGAYSLS
ncbi:MAG: hypothetical protein LCI00_05675 [Chloroflexi bacterium]|nr:hypothetical protein [Chloroflexota bacterium]